MLSFIARGALATASLAFLTTGALADGPVHAASFTASFAKRLPLPLAGANHVLISQVSEGTQKSTGSEKIADGAHVSIANVVEIEQGNGPDRGIYNVVDDKGSTTAAFEGKVTTMMVDGKPQTGAEGTWRWVSSTGAYKGVQGGGTYHWMMTGENDFKGEWKQDMAAVER